MMMGNQSSRHRLSRVRRVAIGLLIAAGVVAGTAGVAQAVIYYQVKNNSTCDSGYVCGVDGSPVRLQEWDYHSSSDFGTWSAVSFSGADQPTATTRNRNSSSGASFYLWRNNVCWELPYDSRTWVVSYMNNATYINVHYLNAISGCTNY